MEDAAAKPGSFGGKNTRHPDLKNHLANCKTVLSECVNPEEPDRKKYLQQLQMVADKERNVVEIELDDVAQTVGEPFVEQILRNTQRYQSLFCEAIDELLSPMKPSRDVNEEDKTFFDIWEAHRMARVREVADQKEKQKMFPAELLRRYELRILPRKGHKASRMRDIRAKDVGSLVKVKGIVTRVTDVQPLIKVVTYICQECGYESYQTVNARQFTPLLACPSPQCVQNKSQGKLFPQTRGSKFVRYQEIKLQELAEEVPVGHVPRWMKLRAYGDSTRKCVPGDIITVAGMFLPSPFTGFRAIRAGLTADVSIEVQEMQSTKKNYNEFVLTPELQKEVEEKSEEKDIYENLAASIAPEIYGHVDIKKALILLLVGGVTRKLPDGMTIRGDINILLMGDPGVAKSQLLKHISQVAPRAVYTTGKGSSGVGLTAAVVRDPITGEMALEGGALVLADNGICCIDEFDKMEEGDRTAIHEVMEQQTVSIAKAGITTSLNARTAVLAAANPVFGRWNKKVSPERNLGLATALLSRFDLTFIILDKADENNDEALARHVTYVHRENKHPPIDFDPFSSSFLRAYIKAAKQFEPYVPPELSDYITGAYVEMRKDSNADDAEAKGIAGKGAARQRFCTARSLLSILRLSQGLARIHFRDSVTREDVEEAMRLMWVSKQTGSDDAKKQRPTDSTGQILEILKKYEAGPKGRGKAEISVAEVRPLVVRGGYSDRQLEETLETYEGIDVLQRSRDGSSFHFLH